MYGASAATVATSAQVNPNLSAPENNFYHPSAMAYFTEGSFGISFLAAKTQFHPINNVVVKNNINSASSESGNVDTDYPMQGNLLLHVRSPIFKKRLKTQVGISVFTPAMKLVDSNTGDDFAPEYVMYRARNSRTMTTINLANLYNQNNSYSVGILGGIQTSGESYLVTRTDGNPSSGKVNFVAKPSAAIILSWSRKLEHSAQLLVTLQDQMKTKIRTQADGISPIGSGSLVPFNLTLSSLLYYDPRILRTTYLKSYSWGSLTSTLEVQDWSGYETPALDVKTQSLFTTGRDLEDIETELIAIPRIAINFQLPSENSLTLGTHYRKSPIKSNLNEGGSSLDPDVLAFNIGWGRRMTILEESFNFHLTLSHHQLMDVDVNKTANNELGAAGSKIGAPGYQAGGSIQALALGMDWAI
jgi:hypothetical protein